jgi:GGDEF domain-containing protein
MSVISIKRLLAEEQQSANHPLKLVQILVRGIGQHAVEGDPDEYREFREAMEQAAASIGQSVTEAAALVILATVLRSLEGHNRATESYLHAGGNDLRAMVKMLTSAIRGFSIAGDENVQRLRLIENRIASAQQGQDIGAIKAQLGVCLQEIRKETERQRLVTANTLSGLQEDLQRARTESTDPATGLSPRTKAVEWIGETCTSRLPAFATCLVIDRLQDVNLTFGSAVGDQVLHYFAAYVQRSLPAGDRLFRWTGASLLAVSPREGHLQQVRKEFALLLESKLEYTFQTPTGDAVLPIAARWTVRPFTANPMGLIEQIDAFASPAPRV